MKKSLLCFLTSYIFAANFSPYLGFVNYNKDTSKSYANIGGFYVSKYQSPYKVEIDAEYLQLKYKDSPDYKQSDLTVLVNYFSCGDKKYKFGIHNIFSSNPETITTYKPISDMETETSTKTRYNNNYDYVLITGFTYYKYLQYDINIDFYYSNYENLNVYQLSSSYGKNFGNYYSKIGSFYCQGKLNYIKLDNSDASSKSSYLSFDLKLQNYKGPWTTTLKLSMGKTAYKVDGGGFVVYNLGDEFKSAYSLGIGRKINKSDFISGTVGYSVFEETKGYEAKATSYILSYSHYF